MGRETLQVAQNQCGFRSLRAGKRFGARPRVQCRIACL
jgi:hypothetical protein